MPSCEVCGNDYGHFYCCAHCARKASGTAEARDRVETRA